jgi:hypothetical protein
MVSLKVKWQNTDMVVFTNMLNICRTDVRENSESGRKEKEMVIFQLVPANLFRLGISYEIYLVSYGILPWKLKTILQALVS